MSHYTMDDLLYLMARLRDPATGCPWDIKQTFSTIVNYTIEEAYEVADAIEHDDFQHLCDELGDLLFQVIFYAQMGAEKDYFDFDNIVHQLVTKLIRRHPHVFPDGELKANQNEAERASVTDLDVKASWEHIKKQERLKKNKSQVLADIPLSLPALKRAHKLQYRAAQVGFDWSDYKPVLDKIREELIEVELAIETGKEEHIQDEIGDLIFCCVNLARHLQVDAEQAVRQCNAKFTRRFNYIEAQLAANEQDCKSSSLAEMDYLWRQAKEKGL
ncbi:nucleoside triphosphate pyrophosphohydrolase [Zooshikella harenae]|uniref:Nucleoside triphosphate pyrophosphohydrolase n=1 Tax=Zooshikella harenae TaxID=2827238 RepID=A0ABS5Z6N3_9GAMM|nr:nucleoside triphosphate pyrophosphohydrolase [Zooshikella harenae]MBU2709715.1 nucleoside triphosphate pyrophosphohydrolase [Zooshikella harenae]